MKKCFLTVVVIFLLYLLYVITTEIFLKEYYKKSFEAGGEDSGWAANELYRDPSSIEYFKSIIDDESKPLVARRSALGYLIVTYKDGETLRKIVKYIKDERFSKYAICDLYALLEDIGFNRKDVVEAVIQKLMERIRTGEDGWLEASVLNTMIGESFGLFKYDENKKQYYDAPNNEEDKRRLMDEISAWCKGNGYQN